jgi:hypothetical protein
MKLFPLSVLTFIIAACCGTCIFTPSSVFAQDELPFIDSRDLAVLASAEARYEPSPAIIISWKKNPLALQYQIRRKNLGSGAWQTIAQSVDTTQTMFTDVNVQIGQAYEYHVAAFSAGRLNNNGQTITNVFAGMGYMCAGIDLQSPAMRGRVLIVVDESLQQNLNDKILRLENDLQQERWLTTIKYVPRTEQFDGAAVKSVKQIIMDEYQKNSSLPMSVILLGRIAVPYSGDIAPDGHTDHRGAWSADLYYGVPDETIWQDTQVNITSASRTINRNAPGDGKFDVSDLSAGSDVEIAIGRIDFFDMPQFAESESDLIERYLDKNHAFRNGQITVPRRGLIDDNFPARNFQEAFASSGWRNAAALMHVDSVRAADWFTTLETEPYLMSYGTGGGTYRSANGVGNTEQFSNTSVNAVFTLLFGSYFGDWDSQNNFLRAAIASEPMALTCGWAARPHWYLHSMGIDEPIGESVVLSQNNRGLYAPNVYNANAQQPTIFALGNRSVHTALMGDPTLRVEMGTVPLVSSIAAFERTPFVAQVSWDVPQSVIPEGGWMFYVYRHAGDEFAEMELITPEPIRDYVLLDTTDGNNNTYTYYVCAVQKNEQFNGSYFMTSKTRSVAVTFNGTSVENNQNQHSILHASISPNPAKEQVTITIDIPHATFMEADIINVQGVTVKLITKNFLSAGQQKFVWNITNTQGQQLEAGIYFLRVQTKTQNFTKQIVVMP